MEICTRCHFYDSRQYVGGFSTEVWRVQLVDCTGSLTLITLHDPANPYGSMLVACDERVYGLCGVCTGVAYRICNVCGKLSLRTRAVKTPAVQYIVIFVFT